MKNWLEMSSNINLGNIDVLTLGMLRQCQKIKAYAMLLGKAEYNLANEYKRSDLLKNRQHAMSHHHIEMPDFMNEHHHEEHHDEHHDGKHEEAHSAKH
jgi:ABC-type nickel/cobalt efflux system permease component RcnA